MLRIERLSVRGTRGIVDGEVDFGRDGLFICGDNGTGKSSFIDSLEKVLTGRCSSLDYGVQGLSWQNHGSHLLGSNQNIVVTFNHSGNQTYELSLAGWSQAPHSDCEDYVTAARQGSYLLRRRTMLEFIATRDSDRYKSLQDFLDLKAFEAFEAELQQREARIKASLAVAETEERTLRESIRQSLELDASSPIDEETCLRALNSRFDQAGIRHLETLAELPAALSALTHALQPMAGVEGLLRRQEASTYVMGIPSEAEVIAALQSYRSALEAVSAERTLIKGAFYADVLRVGLSWLEADLRDTCPLCESNISAEEVKEAIRARLKRHEGLIEKESLASAAVQSYLSLVSTTVQKLDRVLTEYSDVIDQPNIESLKQLLEFMTDVLEKSRSNDRGEALQVEGDLLLAVGIDARVASILQTLRSSQLVQGEGETFSGLVRLQGKVASLEVFWPNLATLRERAGRIRRVSGNLEKVRKHAETARKETVTRILDEVQAYAENYYQQLHPGEQLGRISLTVTQRGAGSIKLQSSFYDTPGDPRGHYSEGHIDSLGLCLFLAIRRLRAEINPAFKLLVLDDVMHSVDGNHRERVAKLIFDEFDDHQIVVTTHDLLWFERLKEQARAHKKELKPYRIAHWSLEGGPQFGDHYSDYEWLKSSEATTALPADVAIKAGRMLEATLQHLCDSLGVAVPFSMKHLPTLEPMWGPCTSKLRKNAAFKQEVGPLLETIDSTKKARNWIGGHNNDWAKGMTKKEADAFAQAAVTLREKVFCEDCGAFIQQYIGLEGYFACPKRHLVYDSKSSLAVAAVPS